MIKNYYIAKVKFKVKLSLQDFQLQLAAPTVPKVRTPLHDQGLSCSSISLMVSGKYICHSVDILRLQLLKKLQNKEAMKHQ